MRDILKYLRNKKPPSGGLIDTFKLFSRMYLLKNTEQTARVSVGKPIGSAVHLWLIHCAPIVAHTFRIAINNSLH
jgi:hypothetical protein